jgi:hypothetical protein
MTGIGGPGQTSDSPFEPHMAQVASFPPSKDRYGASQPGRKTPMPDHQIHDRTLSCWRIANGDASSSIE